VPGSAQKREGGLWSAGKGERLQTSKKHTGKQRGFSGKKYGNLSYENMKGRGKLMPRPGRGNRPLEERKVYHKKTRRGGAKD